MGQVDRGDGRRLGTPAGVAGLARRVRRARRAARATIAPQWKGFAALCVGSVAVLCAAAWPFAKAHLQALEILDLVSGQRVPWVISKAIAEPVGTRELHFETEEGLIRARLYVPTGHANAPGLIVLHGVHHLGIDEPRLMGFAAAMASCGLRVLTPELPDIKDYHVDQSSVRMIGESARWFAVQTGKPVGVMGLSFSGGLALVAAADPLYRPEFKFVFAVGSQDSMNRVARYYRTGEDARPNGTVERLPAHEYGPLVLEYEYLEDFVPRQDVAAVRKVLRAHLYEDKPGEVQAIARLTEAQKGESRKLMDTGGAETRAAIERSTAKHAAEMAGLSPRGRLKRMTTPVYLLHGQADNIIPAAETLWMASELPGEALQAVLVSPVLSHLDVDEAKPGLWDEWRLVHFFALVMHASEIDSGRG